MHLRADREKSYRNELVRVGALLLLGSIAFVRLMALPAFEDEAVLPLMGLGLEPPLFLTRMLHVVVGAIGAVLTYQLAQRSLGRGAAFACGVLFGICPFVVYLQRLALSDIMLCVVGVGVLLGVMRLLEKPTWSRAAVLAVGQVQRRGPRAGLGRQPEQVAGHPPARLAQRRRGAVAAPGAGVGRGELAPPVGQPSAAVQRPPQLGRHAPRLGGQSGGQGLDLGVVVEVPALAAGAPGLAAEPGVDVQARPIGSHRSGNREPSVPLLVWPVALKFMFQFVHSCIDDGHVLQVAELLSGQSMDDSVPRGSGLS